MELLTPQAQSLARAAAKAEGVLEPAPGPGAPAAPQPQPTQEFLNRDLSWLEFNRRVLHEAVDERTPLLERLRFLGIFTSNIDEFFMKRVGGLKRQSVANRIAPTPEGVEPAEALAQIRRAVLPMLRQQGEAFTASIRPKLWDSGIQLLEWPELTEEERRSSARY